MATNIAAPDRCQPPLLCGLLVLCLHPTADHDALQTQATLCGESPRLSGIWPTSAVSTRNSGAAQQFLLVAAHMGALWLIQQIAPRHISRVIGTPLLKQGVQSVPWSRFRCAHNDPYDAVTTAPSLFNKVQLQRACSTFGLPKSGGLKRALRQSLDMRSC